MQEIGKEEKIRGIIAKEIYEEGDSWRKLLLKGGGVVCRRGVGKTKSNLGDRGSWRKNASRGMPEER